MVIGMSANKDIKGFLRAFEKEADLAIFVRSSNYRSADPAELYALSGIQNNRVFEDVPSGLAYALKTAGKGDMICIAGSFYVLSDAFRHLRKQV